MTPDIQNRIILPVVMESNIDINKSSNLLVFEFFVMNVILYLYEYI